MKKGQWILAVLMLGFSAYVYFSVFEKNRQKIKEESASKVIAVSQGLKKIKVKNKESEFTLEYKEGVWWVTAPVVYPAQPDFMERSLTVMNQVASDSQFTLKEDKYGFSNPEATLNLEYNSGDEKSLVLGTAQGVGSQIYILDKGMNKVFVIHNVWGQLFYYSMKNVLSRQLPFKNSKIQQVTWIESGQKKWTAIKNNLWKINYENKSHEVKSEKMLWWLQSIKDIDVKPVAFQQERLSDAWVQLDVKTDKGEDSLFFNKEGDQIYISSLKAIAHLDAFSLKSIEIELKKVLKSAE